MPGGAGNDFNTAPMRGEAESHYCLISNIQATKSHDLLFPFCLQVLRECPSVRGSDWSLSGKGVGRCRFLYRGWLSRGGGW